MEEKWGIGKHIVVIGGGNVAYDVARTSVRNKAQKVTMVCLEAREEQTADEFEIEDGMEEGIETINRVMPLEIMRDEQGAISGVKVQRISQLFDHDGKFNPRAVTGTEFVIECDTVALAIGQSIDESFLKGWKHKDLLAIERGLIKTEKGTGRTTVPKVYAGGDAAFGAALFITAIKHGQDSAIAIDSDLRGAAPYKEFAAEFTEVNPQRDKTYLKTPYALPSFQPPKLRIHNQNMVENNYTPQQAHEQSNRCLQCHISPVFDGTLCIKCNGCVDVCPTNCLMQIPISKLNIDDTNGTVRAAVDNFYGVDSRLMSDEELASMGTAMLKDEDLCIRCGLCAEKCPTQAVTMDAMNYSFRWIG